jgi:hypothetical protein
LLLVFTKADLLVDEAKALPQPEAAAQMRAVEAALASVYDVLGPHGARRCFLSAKTGLNMSALKMELAALAEDTPLYNAPSVVTAIIIGAPATGNPLSFIVLRTGKACQSAADDDRAGMCSAERGARVGWTQAGRDSAVGHGRTGALRLLHAQLHARRKHGLSSPSLPSRSSPLQHLPVAAAAAAVASAAKQMPHK